MSTLEGGGYEEQVLLATVTPSLSSSSIEFELANNQ